jgi:hypothetical protein
MTIQTRAEKGSELTYSEMDDNISELRDSPAGKVFPKTKGVGIQIDTAIPGFGWHDLIGEHVEDDESLNPPVGAIYRDTIRLKQYPLQAETGIRFHMPHDYLPGSDMFIHAHWSHNSALVTGGTVTFGWETIYAKGHDQGAFEASKFVSVIQTASTTQYQHMIAETALSVNGGSATQLDSAEMEVDGIIICRFYLDSNDMTVSGGGVPDPFVHFIDIHYQSTALPTKNRAPDFWT